MFVDTGTNMRSDGVVTTEFHDQLVKRGIIEDDTPPEPEPAVKIDGRYFRPDDQIIQTSSELEEDEEEERIFLEKYKEQKMQKIKQEQKRNKFGRVFTITEPDYTKEVTEASKDADVVLLLTCSGSRDCEKLKQIFDEISPSHAHIKFMTIKANDAIHNYPDSNCPTILVYQQGAIIKTWVTALPFGGNSLSRKSFELELVKLGVLTPAELLGVDGEEDLDLKINKTNDGHTSLFLTAKHGRGNARDEDEDEDEEDDDDRPANNKRNKNHTGSIADTGNDGRGGWKEIRFDLK